MTPGPDHPITVEPATRRWRALFAGHVIADSNRALILREASYPPVVYFPREDVAMEYMSRTDRQTHCPYKGDAGYYTLLMDGHFAENAVWTYDDAAPSVGGIAGHLAFYTDQIEVYEVDDAAVNPHHDEEVRAREAEAMPRSEVDEIIQHTDAGDGRSQREHWEPNVSQPDGGVR
ncbi:DUF427 domain-containing protein [Phenylobacterium sp. J367]|uniref:DUF427 domain-containing protein n=1 Tax=Phenylobacterium sp. J367 TaxID=2898435 RepID=UPI002151E6A6|nr:DUF427 domain-containing protein [Phenylobacterium sp. J367]MCR5877466.1 DUF427 domain-containing protein [Phenylobacterium sp. J367]